ncbi:hypothetical protein SARC_08137 [Sphaeroforma arctica JP610]|uniref:Uncharacterized protein n=1 Tax=Sphaeroforma arctica JP610 TaxID=667725 RepID=A0A0L0FS98_9EUKA|nr:hypothetical protein SARC_08137 [Sphaeroforma arctica JP610]KNC79471.1 hypothetical protein SARC_08137 [Sphaeroforma arctica JP610]|eukprot:XP_014153373.1 hypothetical protein SARC_08137 [Sphaeroforma arctica JP610]
MHPNDITLLTAAVRLLEDGFIPKAFEEGGIIVNPKKEKAGKFGTFTDISSHCEERSPPPTMVVQELISRLILETNPGPDSGGSSPGSENNTSDGVASPDPDPSTSLAGDEVTGTNEVTLTEEATSSLKRMFDRYSQAKVYMSPEDVGEWLVTINGVVGRGSEFRAAVACMSGGGRSGDGSNTSANLYESNDPGLKIDTVEEGSMSGGVDGEGSAVADLGTPAPAALPSNGRLAWEDFEGIYKDEIKAGKFWGVQHDLNACGCPLQDSPQREGEVFSGRYDRIYIGGGLQPPDILAVRDSVCDRACPNDEQGSDHLPVGVVVRIY